MGTKKTKQKYDLKGALLEIPVLEAKGTSQPCWQGILVEAEYGGDLLKKEILGSDSNHKYKA